MKKTFTGLFTSESVSQGHPDKVADYVADSLLTEYLKQDKQSHVAIEVMIQRGVCIVGGNVKSNANINIDEIVRNAIKECGYDSEYDGYNANEIAVVNIIDKQSSDIDEAVIHSLEERDESTIENEDVQGAGDQGMQFGYACKETKNYMPLALAIAHRLLKKLYEIKSDCYGGLTYSCINHDAKSQVTVEYKEGKPIAIDTIVLSVSHQNSLKLDEMRGPLIVDVIAPVLKEFDFDWFDCKNILINPSGKFVICGPTGDTGMTGRKLIVDSYGGYCPHAGGATSGKDPSKVDRSAAYYARYVAKNLVASGVCDECTVQVAYAIGKAKPVSVNVDTYGTGRIDDNEITSIVNKIFDFRPLSIIKQLDLLNVDYRKTTFYGNYGKDDLPWEKLDKIDELKAYWYDRFKRD